MWYGCATVVQLHEYACIKHYHKSTTAQYCEAVRINNVAFVLKQQLEEQMALI